MASIKPFNVINSLIPRDFMDPKTNSYYDIESQTWVKKSEDFVIIINDHDSDLNQYNVTNAASTVFSGLKSYVFKLLDYSNIYPSSISLFKSSRV
jgi:hypothetical protein